MTKLRNRLLVTLALAAVVLATAGVEIAAAQPPLRRNPHPSPSGTTSPLTVIRPGAGTFTGEPDPTGTGAPSPEVKPASLSSLPNFWLLQWWLRWREKGQIEQHQPYRH